MKRVDQSSEGGELSVVVTASVEDMRRFTFGVAAYAAGLRKSIGYGLAVDRGPATVDRLREALSGATDIEVPPQPPFTRAEKQKRAELTPDQADLAYVVAQTMVAAATEAEFLSKAFAWDDERGSRGLHGWHENPVLAWGRYAEGLAPPATPEP